MIGPVDVHVLDRADDVDIADRLAPSSQAAGDLGAVTIPWSFAHALDQLLAGTSASAMPGRCARLRPAAARLR